MAGMIVCPHCQRKLHLFEQYRGQEVMCSGCMKPFCAEPFDEPWRIPEPDESSSTSDQITSSPLANLPLQPTDDEPSIEASRRRPRSSDHSTYDRQSNARWRARLVLVVGLSIVGAI